MIQNHSRLLVFAFSLLLTGEVLALACDAVFSNAVGTTGGKLHLKDNATLLNTGDRVLATGELKTNKNQNNCDSQPCVEDGTGAPALSIPPNNSNTDLKDQSLNLTPGDYYFDKFELENSNSITLLGTGQVRIHVAGHLKITDDALVNVNGNPLDLVFLVAGKVEIKDDAQVKAVIYAEEKLKIEDDAVVEGAFVGSQAEIKGDASVTYTTTETLEIDGVCSPVAGLLDHVRMTHDGIGVVGVPETVTLTACANADCSQLLTGSLTVNLLPADASTWWSGSGVSGNQVTFSGGTLVIELNRSIPGTFDIGLSPTPASVNPTRCYVGATESCSITYPENVFAVSLPDQVSAATSFGSVSVPSCWWGFQSRTVAVEVAAQYVSPVWAGPAVMVNGFPLPTDGSTVAVDLTFDASCNVPVQVDYADAGEIGLVFTHVGSGATSGLTVTGADNLVFYPAALSISATSASGTNLDATAATAAPVHVAAENFVLTISALNAAGAVTQGYRPQAVDRLLVYPERTGPTAGSEGVIRISPGGSIPTRLNPPSGPGDYVPANVSASDFVKGVFTNAAAYYTEVGLVSLYLMDLDYMGHMVSASALDIGRFVPAGFELDAGATVSNRVTTAGCAGSTFTYMDEQLSLSVQLKAVNAFGAVTRNYRDSFASFAGSGFSSYAGVPGNTLGARSGSTALSDRLSLAGSGLSVPWSDGLAMFEVFLSVSPATSPDGPYDATEFGLAFRDADGVALQSPDLDVDGDAANDHVRLGASRIRAGRVSIGNAHGSELQALSVPVVVQYFAGSGLGFMTHTLDNCTQLASALLSDVDAGDALVVADTCIVDEFAASGANACLSGTTGIQYRGTALAGEYAVSLKAPGATKVGAMRVTADAPDWAQFDWTGSGSSDPQGIATFGIYNRETEFIYQREIR